MNQEELKQRLVELLEPFVSGGACEHESGSCELADCRSCNARNLAERLIANGVTIRERGEWVKYPHNSGIYCSVCHGKARYKDIYKPFCPHCGADLRGVKDE